jgi:hypothetical protein
MANRIIKAGTSQRISHVDLFDPVTGSPKTGLVFNSSGLTCYFTRPGSASVAVTLVTQTVTGAYANATGNAGGGFVEVDSAHCPGRYRFDIPDAMIAAGATGATAFFTDGSGNLYGTLDLELWAVDPQDATRFNLSALPNVAAGADGGLGVFGASQTVAAKQLNIINSGGDALVCQSTGGNGSGISATGIGAGSGIKGTAGNTSGSGIIGLQSAGTGSGIVGAGITAGITGQGLTNGDGITGLHAGTGVDIRGNITGNLSGSVGSVTGGVGGSVGGSVGGAVGSVTGNVGGSVLGSVGSVVNIAAQTGDSFARLGAPANATIAADIAEVEGETDAIGSLPTAAQIATAVFVDLFSSADFSTVGSFGAWAKANIAQSGDSFARLGGPAGASVSADIASIKTDTSVVPITVDTVSSAASTSVFTGTTCLNGTLDYPNMDVAFDGNVTAGLKGISRRVASKSGQTFTLNSPLPTTPAVGDTFVILGYGG